MSQPFNAASDPARCRMLWLGNAQMSVGEPSGFVVLHGEDKGARKSARRICQQQKMNFAQR